MFTVAYIPIHLYWALGGTFWLPGGVMTPARLSAVRTADWAVCVVLAVGAVNLLALARPAWSRRVPPVVLVSPMWIGVVVCLSPAAYGFITKGLYLAGNHDAVTFPTVPGESAATVAAHHHSAAMLDLAVFEPWFLIPGWRHLADECDERESETMEIVKRVRPPKGLRRLLFRLPIAVYRLGFGWLFGRRIMLLNHVGQVTGKPRQVVLEVVAHDGVDGSYVVASGWGPRAPRLMGFAVDGSKADFRAVGQQIPFIRLVPRT